MKGFIRTSLTVMVGLLLAATAWAGPMVDAHLDEMGAQNDALQAQVDEHELALEALNARHGDAQAALADAQAAQAAAETARAAAQASLDALNAQLAMEQAADDGEHLDALEAAVVDFYEAAAPHYLELVASHGVEGAAGLIAERMGVDPSVVAPLLLQPMMLTEEGDVTITPAVAEEVPAEGGEADAEEPAEAPDATDDSAGESGAEGSDTSDE